MSGGGNRWRSVPAVATTPRMQYIKFYTAGSTHNSRLCCDTEYAFEMRFPQAHSVKQGTLRHVCYSTRTSWGGGCDRRGLSPHAHCEGPCMCVCVCVCVRVCACVRVFGTGVACHLCVYVCVFGTGAPIISEFRAVASSQPSPVTPSQKGNSHDKTCLI